MRFAQPIFLWLLPLVVGLLLVFLFWAWRTRQKLLSQFVQARLLSALTVGLSPQRQKLRFALLVAAVAFLMLALARPQWGFVWEETRQQGLDIVVAIDTSRSMLAADVAPNRLTRAKLAALDLMRLAKNDRLGLVAFAGSAFLQAPLTLDEEAFRQNLEALDVNIIPEGGTVVSEAIKTALSAFEKGNDNHKVLVLFTDGEDHDRDSETLAAAEAAAKEGLMIFTIGVGTAEGELLRAPDEHGSVGFIKDDDGNVVKSHLNETLLQKIATAAKGFYLPLRGANPIDTLYARGLAPLPKSDAATKLTRIYQERYHWPLGLALICLLSEMFLPDLKRAKTSVLPALSGKSELSKAAVLALLLIPMLALASPSGALRQYKAGRFDKAQEEYERLAQTKTNDYRLHYNAGTAAYRAKQLGAAQKHLSDALNSPEISSDLETQQRAYYNLGNTLFQLGAPLPDPEKKTELWEQSIQNYAHALRLNPQDLDATNNLVFVKRKLEELKQQQQQQQKGGKNDKDKKDQKDQQDQQNQQEQKSNKDDQKQQDSKQQQQQQQQAKQDKADPQKAEQAEQEKQQQAVQKEKEKEQEQQQAAAAKPDKDKQSGETNAQASASVAQMTPQQAKQFLDAQKQDERALIFSPEKKPEQLNRRIKNW